jgi:anaerobic ribonucleoside-triphosphate reductase activating protein
MKYVEYKITFAEIPDEISLCINISGCENACIGCHSPWLQKDIGFDLNSYTLSELVSQNQGITCVCLMGGDSDPKTINELATTIHNLGLKSAWYSGKQELVKEIDITNFDYIKLGPYSEEFGPLTIPTTNQRMYKIEDSKMTDVTYKFWK